MSARRKKTLGVGAQCSVASKYLHPKQLIKDTFKNAPKDHVLGDLLAIKKTTYMMSGVPKTVIVFRHDALPNNEICCIPRWVKVAVSAPTPFEQERAVPARVAQGERENPLPGGPDPDGLREDIEKVREAGLGVDDDNEQMPDNIPSSADANLTSNWGWNKTCPRRQSGATNMQPKLKMLASHLWSTISLVSMFCMFIPKLYFEQVVIPETNKRLGVGNEMDFGEFLQYIGVWLAISTCAGYQKHEFWALHPVDFFEGAPTRFHEIMSARRFDAITRNLTFTNIEPPSFSDKFHYVRQLIKAWNDNMALVFSCGWISCLDESMSIWTSRWTCPGWMFVPRKPHPMGNEYHSICCGLSGIMFAIEIVEGKDSPPQLIPEFASHGPTPALLLRLCKSIFATGKIVILDSGFQVLQALSLLAQNGVYASAVIKKRKTWPKYVDGDAMDAQMMAKEVGDCDALNGVLDSIPFTLFTMKDVDYSMKLMSTYGALLPPSHAEERQRKLKDGTKKRFKYTEPFYNHFKFRHAVDDHNNLRQGSLSLEETWVTKIWEYRVFAFILAISEVNTYLAFRFFVWKGKDKNDVDNKATSSTFLRFRRRLAKALIYNEFVKVGEPGTTTPATKKRRKANTSPTDAHKLVSAPKHAKTFEGGKWICTAKCAYQQYVCKHPGCKKQVRTYCMCTTGAWLCKEHHVEHIVDITATHISPH